MLDVRPAYAFIFGHITGAYNIPSGSLAERLDEIADWQDLDIVVYCTSSSCGLSASASGVLADNGFTKVHSMPEGYEDWADAGYDTESERTSPFCCHADSTGKLAVGEKSGDGLVLIAAAAVLCGLPRLSRRTLRRKP